MSSTFSTIKTTLDEIAARIQKDDKRLARATSEISVAEADLGAMPSAYSVILADVDAAAAAQPANTALQNAKSQKDLLVAEFQALQARATAMKQALEALG